MILQDRHGIKYIINNENTLIDGIHVLDIERIGINEYVIPSFSSFTKMKYLCDKAGLEEPDLEHIFNLITNLENDKKNTIPTLIKKDDGSLSITVLHKDIEQEILSQYSCLIETIDNMSSHAIVIDESAISKSNPLYSYLTRRYNILPFILGSYFPTFEWKDLFDYIRLTSRFNIKIKSNCDLTKKSLISTFNDNNLQLIEDDTTGCDLLILVDNNPLNKMHRTTCVYKQDVVKYPKIIITNTYETMQDNT